MPILCLGNHGHSCKKIAVSFKYLFLSICLDLCRLLHWAESLRSYLDKVSKKSTSFDSILSFMNSTAAFSPLISAFFVWSEATVSVAVIPNDKQHKLLEWAFQNTLSFTHISFISTFSFLCVFPCTKVLNAVNIPLNSCFPLSRHAYEL